MTFVIEEDEYIKHYGILRRSGRYPWGSGNNAKQRATTFSEILSGLRAEGMTDAEIAKAFGLSSTTDLRNLITLASNERRAGKIREAQKLKDKGWSNVAIGEKMGIAESSVRALLAPGAEDKANILRNTVEMLKETAGADGIVDVGTDTNRLIGINKRNFDAAVAALKNEEGWNVWYIREKQLGTDKETTIKVLTPPDVTYSEASKRRGEIITPGATTKDNGRSFEKAGPPQPVSSKRVDINYGGEGGELADGVIYLRPGVDDLSLGKSRYAQVRIQVDDTHYLKGMAVYKDDLPDGVDIVFNTNKSRADVEAKGIGVKGAMKELDLTNPDNPFGATIRDQRGAINILTEEGGWEGWTDSLSSQVLSKQSPKLAKTQLDLLAERRSNDLAEIMSLTNPTVRKKLLESFADGVDADVTDLRAAELPNQAWHVILPSNSLKPTEVYAPNYQNGERVALVRYPHGGIFEIPELIVNNNHAPSKKLIGENARDAIALNAEVAQRLSGADFDGDTVLVIPNNSGRLKSSSPLKGLEGFDPQAAYPGYEGMKKMKKASTGREMGDVSNLITDMTVKNASSDEIARAIRHSMVVIDAAKHGLDYKRSAEENGIQALKEKYQDGGGASTLISRAKRPLRVNQIRPARVDEGGPIDPKTGKKVFVETGESYMKDGKRIYRVSKRKELATVDDAFELSSGTTIETVYAKHANRMKRMAERARVEMLATPNLQRSPSAAKAYRDEVDSLNSKLDVALSNRPLERRAQLLGNAVYKQKVEANPSLDSEQRKRLKGQELTRARERVGASKTPITITDREWEAIQAGAVSNSKLKTILDNTDMDEIRRLATPRTPTVMTSTAVRRAKQMAAAGYTQAEIASQLGVSPSSISQTLAEE